jgi:hypothetical protein
MMITRRAPPTSRSYHRVLHNAVVSRWFVSDSGHLARDYVMEVYCIWNMQKQTCSITTSVSRVKRDIQSMVMHTTQCYCSSSYPLWLSVSQTRGSGDDEWCQRTLGKNAGSCINFVSSTGLVHLSKNKDQIKPARADHGTHLDTPRNSYPTQTQNAPGTREEGQR